MSRPPLRSRVAPAQPGRAAAALVAGLAAAALLAGCGSDAETSETSAEDPAGETPSASPAASPTESATTAPTDAASPTPTAPASSEAATLDLPACDTVWVAGQKLPGGYEGCLAADGSPVDAGGLYCEFGKPIFSYGKRFYAVSNGPVNQTDGPLSKDPQYRSALRTCGG